MGIAFWKLHGDLSVRVLSRRRVDKLSMDKVSMRLYDAGDARMSELQA
jgi:hypothetical protein